MNFFSLGVMTPERWQRIEDVYHAACGHEPAAERAEFLAEVCGNDEELRREVESLLSQSGVPFILDRPAISPHEAAFPGDAARPGIGMLFGPYRIEVPIGKGGMGEVWKARDTRLNREVAIKISAQQFTDRFAREARAIATLNDSNICTLHDVGPNFMVMELVEGPTLAERLRKGPISLEESLAIAKQIAGALEAAHERGIVHRDLKPANIKIRPGGTVKVLDFGLAKATGDETGLDADSGSVPGMIVGTPAYMPPEQARGDQVDKRADIWAFGVVLYEMVTRQRLFEGKSVSDTLAAVMTREPEWERVPPKVQPLLRRCLEKDPARRLRDISGVELLLEDAPVPAGMRPGNKTWIAFAGIFALAAAAVSYVHFREEPMEKQVLRYSVGPPGDAVLDHVSGPAGGGVMSGWLSPIAISPDGQKVVFNATSADGKNQLWVRFLDTLPARPLAGTEKARYPFWSPDSRSIGFGADGKLKRIDITGGPVVALADARAFNGGTWNREDTILFVRSLDERLMRVAAAGGAAGPATGLGDTKEEYSHRWPWFLPDGRHFLFAAPVTEWGDQSDHVTICAGSLDSPNFKIVTEADSNAVYAEGYLLFLRESTLMAQPFDLKSLSVAGNAVPIAERVQHNPPSAKGLFSVSENGVLAYSAGGQNARRLTWFDRKGKRLSTAGEPGWFGVMHLSPDRKKLAVPVSDRAETDIWIYDLPRGLRTRFTSDAALKQDAIWSPDGRSIVFNSNRSGHMDLYRKASDGTGTEELLYTDGVNKFPEDWSPDGRFLLYSTFDAKTKSDIWVLPMRAERVAAPLKPYPWLRTAFSEVATKFSPDGRWVAYQSNESGRLEIYVAPFRGPGGKQQVSTAGGHYARWRQDGREIFYQGPDRELMAVEVNAKGTTVEIGKAQRLFGPLVSGLGYLYDVSADGQRFLAAVPPEEHATQELTVVQNWTAALKK